MLNKWLTGCDRNSSKYKFEVTDVNNCVMLMTKYLII